MAVVKRIKKRNATVTVESHAEILFMPGGSVNNWTNRFTGVIRARTKAAAPSNTRPRWGHYGKPLKETIVSARPRFWGNGRDRQRVYAAVGATAPHAYFVDQGTGIFGGNGPYEAKILPPWQPFSASLYERTWRPGGPGTRRVAPVMIKGQPGQHFFDKGLADAFHFMVGVGRQSRGAAPRITEALSAMPSGLENFVGSGNTSANPAFRVQLAEWRRWRDEAWEAGEGLGRGGGIGSRAHERAVSASRGKPRPPKQPKATKPTKPKPVKPTKPKPDTGGYATLGDKQTAAVAAFVKQNPNVRILNRIAAGLVVVSPITKQRYVIPWSRIYNLL